MFLTATLGAQDGRAIYREHCASCHDGGVARAPQADALKQMSPASVQFPLKSGAMLLQGSTLTESEIRAVSEFVTGKVVNRQEFTKQAYCSGPTPS